MTEESRSQAIAALTPFFLASLTDDETAARVIAEGVLRGDQVAAPTELGFTTQIVAFGWASLACTSAAMMVKQTSPAQVLRLHDTALTLDRLAQKAARALETCRRERVEDPLVLKAEDGKWNEGALRLAIDRAIERIRRANAELSAFMAASGLVERKLKTSFITSEPMTPAVLARRRRH